MNILRWKKAFKVKQKTFSLIFKRLSVARNCFGPGSENLRINWLKIFDLLWFYMYHFHGFFFSYIIHCQVNNTLCYIVALRDVPNNTFSVDLQMQLYFRSRSYIFFPSENRLQGKTLFSNVHVLIDWHRLIQPNLF